VSDRRWGRIGLLGVIAVFLAVSAWWLVADSSVLDWDSARHFTYTWAMRDALWSGDLLAPITQTPNPTNPYPPMLYLVGTIGMAIGGRESIDAAMAAANIVFVPLLALGCWGAARLAYGELAGVLAAVFALGTPFVASLFHLYVLDAPQASMVAVTVWLLLASRRFERVGTSALAGAAGAGAMLLKPTSVIFLAGILAVVLVRGGWRRPQGLGAFLAAGAVLAAPWYLEHLDELTTLTGGAAGGSVSSGGGGGSYVSPPRLSVTNFAWYGWNLLNVQLLAPLFFAFIAGTVVALVRFWRTRDEHDYTPELFVGGLVAYLGMTYLSLKDARYTLPALVYVATLGVAWVPALRLPLRRVAVAALVAVAAVNLIGVSAGIGGTVAIKGPDSPATLLGERSVRLYSSAGFVQSAPRDDGDVLRVMKELRADGVRTIEVDPGGDHTFSLTGLQVLMSIAGLGQPPVYQPDKLPPGSRFLTRHQVAPGTPPPCGMLSGGWGLYVVNQRNVVVPFENYNIECPRDAVASDVEAVDHEQR
jgi:4-amino-4-deoxy-L-arabinose transferase-like glycosyltransferase